MPEDAIAFQGSPGAYSDLACRQVRPDLKTHPCVTFEEAFEAVQSGRCRFGMIPVDNSLAGRVADVHHLLPDSGLFIIGEHFQRVNHQLLVLPGVRESELEVVSSHVHALNQCRRLIHHLGLRRDVHSDTAGAARALAESGTRQRAVIASSLAAELYGLEVLRSDIEDEDHNTTRFLLMARQEQLPEPDQPCLTSLMFSVGNTPAALYDALGSFAINSVNMVKLESYLDEDFKAADFFVDIEGHRQSPGVRRALERLDRHTAQTPLRIFGTYPAHPFRRNLISPSL